MTDARRAIVDQWAAILQGSPGFSTQASVTLEDGQVLNVSGFLCSGSYGERSETGYMRAKSVVRTSFQCSSGDVGPLLAGPVRKARVAVDGTTYTIVRTLGAKSGITVLELVEKGGSDGDKAQRQT